MCGVCIHELGVDGEHFATEVVIQGPVAGERNGAGLVGPCEK